MDDFDRADSYLDAGHGHEAIPLFMKLAECGRVDAMHSIAHTYLYGIAGIERDLDRAFAWFTRAAAGGCPQAMYHLGLCNAMGYGTPENPVQAVSWYKKSAERGDEDAEYRVGDCYERGFGVAQNTDEAIRWYRRAAAQGQPDAMERLQKISNSG